MIQHSLKFCSVAQIERCSIIHQCLIMGVNAENWVSVWIYWWVFDDDFICGCFFKIQVQYPLAINQPGFLSYQSDGAFLKESGIKRKRCLPGRTENPVWIAVLEGWTWTPLL